MKSRYSSQLLLVHEIADLNEKALKIYDGSKDRKDIANNIRGSIFLLLEMVAMEDFEGVKDEIDELKKKVLFVLD